MSELQQETAQIVETNSLVLSQFYWNTHLATLLIPVCLAKYFPFSLIICTICFSTNIATHEWKLEAIYYSSQLQKELGKEQEQKVISV